jgi:sodium/potassium-transporting ATPase subunit alpha
VQKRFPKVFEVPFTSETKWHLSIHKIESDHGSFVVYVKGAPERVLRLCDKIVFGDKVC